MKLTPWPTKRKYKLGNNPCGSCATSHQHEKCRPRLDCTLCSCSCPQAQRIRAAYEKVASEKGVTDFDRSLVPDAVKTLCPRFQPDPELMHKTA